MIQYTIVRYNALHRSYMAVMLVALGGVLYALHTSGKLYFEIFQHVLKDRFKSNQTSHFFIFMYFLYFIESNSGLVQGFDQRFQTVKDECEPLVRVMSEWYRNMIKCTKMRVKVK